MPETPLRRQQQKDATRGLILDSARLLLSEKGYEAMSTRAVAERARVGVGTVFLHFPDKGALIEALLHDHIESALAGALACLPAGGFVAELVHVAARLFAAYDANPALARTYLRETLFFAPGSERPLAVQLQRFQEWAAARCAEAIRRGEIPPIAAPQAFTAFFSFYLALLIAGLRGDMTAADRIVMLEALVRRHFRLEDMR
jgi:AcrR family transcriptional regulator